MIVSIHQPSYWPWLGLLDKIAKSDIFVILDIVAANRDSYQYRNIFFCNGDKKFLTIAVNYEMGKMIKELEFRNNDWQKDHLNKLKNYYLKSRYFEEIYPLIERIYSAEYKTPVEFIVETMTFTKKVLGIKTQFEWGSKLDVEGKKAELVLNICKKLKADSYLSGMGAREYLQPILYQFKKENIKVLWQQFSHPQYTQNSNYPFVEGLSCLDLLFFQGIENSRRIFWDNINENKAFIQQN